MTTEPMAALLTVLRMVGYAGFVLWAGPLTFWTLVWPTGHRHRRLLWLSGVGAVLMILTSIAEPMIRLTAGGQPLDEVAPPLAGAAILLRLAILVGSLFYLVDLVGGAVVGKRRVIVFAAMVVVAATVAVQPMVLGQPGPLLAALGTTIHLLATAAWLGGLVALAAVVRPGAESADGGGADGLVTRFSPVATLGLVLLVLASGLTILAGTSAVADERQGSILVVRFGLLAALLLVAWYAHRATARLAFRRLFSPLGATGSARDRTLILVVGTELAIAFGALSAAVLIALSS
jgi:putative copper export protein